MKRAFTIVELVVVAAIFGTAVVAFFGAAAISFKAIAKASDKVQAAFLMEEGLEGVRYLRDLSWKKFIDKEQLGYEQCFYFDTSGSPPKNLFATSTPEIVGQWHLDEPAGTTGANTILDTSTFTNNGTQSNGVVFGDPGVNVNNITNYRTSATFNGATNNRYISTSNLTSTLGLSSDMSIEAWVKPNASTGVGSVIISSSEWSGCEVCGLGGLDMVANKPRFNIPATGSSVVNAYSISAPTAISAAVWHHILGAYVESTKTGILYVDGVAVVSGGHSGTGPLVWQKPFKIGTYKQSTGPSNSFDGSIDEIAIYNRALTATEVLDRYNGHAVCPTVTAADDNSQTFKRTVKFENVCRDNSSGGIMGYTTGTPCPGGQIAYNKTKKATVKIIWGSAREFVESADMYISDLFLR